jgi:hypothetical protein
MEVVDMSGTVMRKDRTVEVDTTGISQVDGFVHRRVRRAWAVSWFGLVVLGVANGAIRQSVYADALGDLRAHQVSTVTLLLLLAIYLWTVDRRWPTPSMRFALQTGGLLAAATIAFEIVFGMYLRPDPLTLGQVLHDYDVTAGRVWVLVPLFLMTGPALMRRLRTRHTGA